MTNSICDLFKLLAELTWQRIGEAYATNLKWSEETNTETLLLELKNHFPGKVGIRAFSRKEEASNGSDWEWWIIGKKGLGYPMRVQAKRIKLPREDFGHLGYKAKKQPLNQMDTLITKARAMKMRPMYCFYTHSVTAIHCLSCRNQIAVGSCGRLHGCLMGYARAVKLVRSNKLSDLSKILIPWHKLACSDALAGSNWDLAEIVENAVANLIALNANVLDKRLDYRDEPMISRREIPSYVNELLDGSTERLPAPSSEQLAWAAENKIKGIIAIQQTG